MSFAIFSDPSCNLPRAQLEEFQVQIIPASYEREGKLIPCPRYPEAVSYTHLDVYKRQVQKWGHGVLPQSGYSFLGGHSVFKGLAHR